MKFFEQIREVFHLAMRKLLAVDVESAVWPDSLDHSRPGGATMSNNVGSRPDDVFGRNKKSPVGKIVVAVIVIILGLVIASKLSAQTTQATSPTVAELSAKLEQATAVASDLSAQLAWTRAMLEARQPENPAMPNPTLFETFPACVDNLVQYLPAREAVKNCLEAREMERNRARDAAKAQRPVFSNAGLYGGNGFLYGGGVGAGFAIENRNVSVWGRR
jgi:hypothetical protein